MSDELKPGDVVRLRSGGPAMTVLGIDGDGDVDCIWICTGNERLEREQFAPVVLVRVEQPQSSNPLKDWQNPTTADWSGPGKPRGGMF